MWGRGQLDWKLRNDPRVVCMEENKISGMLRRRISGSLSIFLPLTFRLYL